MPFKINLDLFYHSNSKGKEWSPEIFTGLCWRPPPQDGARITFAIFDTGKGVATGLKKPEQMAIANSILEELWKYEKGNEQVSFPATMDASVTRSRDVKRKRAVALPPPRLEESQVNYQQTSEEQEQPKEVERKEEAPEEEKEENNAPSKKAKFN